MLFGNFRGFLFFTLQNFIESEHERAGIGADFKVRGVLRRAGFEIERITYTNATLFPLILAARTAQRLMGLASPEEARTDIAVPPAPVNTLLSGLLAAEGFALRYVNMPVGSSLLCLARKP